MVTNWKPNVTIILKIDIKNITSEISKTHLQQNINKTEKKVSMTGEILGMIEERYSDYQWKHQ